MLLQRGSTCRGTSQLQSSTQQVGTRRAGRMHCSGSSIHDGKETELVAFRVRQARLTDSGAVASLYSQVFGANNFPGFEDSPFIQQLEADYAAAVGRDSGKKLEEALTNKARAAVSSRTYRVMLEAAMLKAQLLMAQGQPARFPTEGPTELRQIPKWKRARRFVCLVAEQLQADGQPGLLLGTATVSMMQAEAALPPPFPSNAPLRPYISNMAVLPQYRRQGLAKALVGACGRIARAWGEPSVLLHVAADNLPAQHMYSSCGFAALPNSQGLSGLIKGPWTQQRMVADSGLTASNYFVRTTSGGSSSSNGISRATHTGPSSGQEALVL